MPVVEERTSAVEPPPVDGFVDPEALIEEARRRQRRRRQLSVLVLGLVSAVAAGGYLIIHLSAEHPSAQHPQPSGLRATTHRSPIRVILTAQNHHPSASDSPSVHWGYCVKVRTAAGKPLAAPIQLQLQLLSGRTPVAGVGRVWLKKGYDNWCGGIGGETNALLAVPRGKKLRFEAVVTALGVTVKRYWPLVVR